MPIITFNASDKMAAVTAEAGWQSMVMTKCEARTSKSGASINYWTEFEVRGGKYEGKELKITFNTEVNSSSVLGSMHLMPIHSMLALRAAIEKKAIGELSDQVDTDTLLNQPFDGKIEVTPVEGGGLMNTISQFAPAGTGVNAKAAF